MTALRTFGVSDHVIADLAEQLQAAARTATPIAPLTETEPGLTVDGAYAVAERVAQSRLAAGAKLTGHKIGLTSRAMQQMLGVSEPDYGHLYDDITLRNGSVIDTARLIAPRVEPEIAIVLASDLPTTGQVTAEDVRGAADVVLPALEVIDSRIADWKIKLVDTVADNASCAAVVLGQRRTAAELVDLVAEPVKLRLNGRVVHEGTGAAVLGDPARAVAWLANALARYGVALQAGQVLMPGSMTAAIAITAGDLVEAEFGTLGTVEVTVK